MSWPHVFMYHAVSRTEVSPGLCVSPERFEKHMSYLKRRGLRGVSMRELHRAAGSGKARGLVGLTFDDGYRNFRENALPVLQSFGFSATVFAVAGMLGEENSWVEADEAPSPLMPLMDAAELRELAEHRVEVGSHTMSHPRLGGLREEELEREVEDSKSVLETILDAPVEGFCYPYGSLDAAAVRAVSRAGYAYGCATKTRSRHSVHDWPRMFIGQRDGPVRLTIKRKVYSPYARLTRNR